MRRNKSPSGHDVGIGCAHDRRPFHANHEPTRRSLLGGIGPMTLASCRLPDMTRNGRRTPLEMKMSQGEKKRVIVDGLEIAYRENGAGRPIVFLHGNPTSSYLWRNIIPAIESLGRCIAPDLIGMGDSAKLPNSGPGSYGLAENQRYLDGFMAALGLDRDVVLVVHDWGSVLGLDWARRHPAAVRGVAHMEALVGPARSAAMPPAQHAVLMNLRSPAGEREVLEDNRFVEFNLPRGIVRKLTEEEMAEYRRPFLRAGEDRRPTLTWPRQLPIDGDPADVTYAMAANDAWMRKATVPKLYVRAEPGTHSPEMIATCQAWANQTEAAVKAIHYPQEDSPTEVAAALSNWLRSLDRS